MMSKRFWLLMAVLATASFAGVGTRAWLARYLHADESPSRFVPPNERQRLAAIGSTKQLSRGLRRAFEPSDDFQEIPAPRGSDWLAQHSEAGQSYAQFLKSQPNRPDRQRNKIYLQPLGEFPEAESPDLALLKRFAESFFVLPVDVCDPVTLDDLPIKSRSRGKNAKQLLSTDVLDWLKTRVPDDGYCLLAVTMDDLYPDERWNFVFGQASLRDRVGVYSFARYDPEFYGEASGSGDSSLVLKRSCKVLCHETGHMFGIPHCVHFHCLMNGSNHLGETDAAPIHLCPVCLRKLQSSVGFDVTDRYKALQQFAESAGWENESEWLSRRIEFLSNP